MTDHCIVLATCNSGNNGYINYYAWDTSTSTWGRATSRTVYSPGDNVYLTFFVDSSAIGAHSPQFNFSPFEGGSIIPDTVATESPTVNPPKNVSGGNATAHIIGSGCPDTFDFTSSFINAADHFIDPDGTIVVEN